VINYICDVIAPCLATVQAEGQDCSTTNCKRVGKDEEVENAFFAWLKFSCGKNAHNLSYCFER